MTIASIVLNYAEPDQTLDCVSSLSNVADTIIYVIDNGSPDDSTNRLRDSSDIDHLIEIDDNRGFAGGMNIGINKALSDGGDFIWLLNNDIEFPSDFDLSRLLGTVKKEGVGAASPLIYDKNENIWFSKGELDWDGVNARNLTDPVDGVVETDHMSLAAPLVDADVFQQIQLPEQYFMYWEDVEWGVRVRDAGYRLVTNGNVPIKHDSGGSSGQALKSYYGARNRQLFRQEFADRAESFVLPYLWLMTKLTVGRALERDTEAMAAIWKGVIDGALGRTGKGRYP